MLRLSYEIRNNPPDLLFVPAHIIPFFSPKKTVTTIHDVGFRRFPHLYSNTELKYHNFGLNQALKNASKIITISEFSKREMLDLCEVDPEKIFVVYQGFNSRDYRPIEDKEEIEKIKRKYKLPEKYLLYVGRLNYKKNIPNLIKAFKKISEDPDLKDRKLVLVGQPETGYDFILKEINDQNLKDRIIELGWTDSSDMPYIMNGAELFVFPSKYEGFGIPPLEAMSCNVPVAAANVASIPEVVGEAAILFDPDSPNDIYQKISSLVKNMNLRGELIEKGKKRVLDFSWKKCAQETLDVLNSLL
jgi:glycosyltransferase involved in cell wall biosynthesis